MVSRTLILPLLVVLWNITCVVSWNISIGVDLVLLGSGVSSDLEDELLVSCLRTELWRRPSQLEPLIDFVIKREDTTTDVDLLMRASSRYTLAFRNGTKETPALQLSSSERVVVVNLAHFEERLRGTEEWKYFPTIAAQTILSFILPPTLPSPPHRGQRTVLRVFTVHTGTDKAMDEFNVAGLQSALKSILSYGHESSSGIEVHRVTNADDYFVPLVLTHATRFDAKAGAFLVDTNELFDNLVNTRVDGADVSSAMDSADVMHYSIFLLMFSGRPTLLDSGVQAVVQRNNLLFVAMSVCGEKCSNFRSTKFKTVDLSRPFAAAKTALRQLVHGILPGDLENDAVQSGQQEVWPQEDPESQLLSDIFLRKLGSDVVDLFSMESKNVEALLHDNKVNENDLEQLKRLIMVTEGIVQICLTAVESLDSVSATRDCRHSLYQLQELQTMRQSVLEGALWSKCVHPLARSGRTTQFFSLLVVSLLASISGAMMTFACIKRMSLIERKPKIN